MPDDRVVVFIDYQNVYHRARASFFEGADPPVQVGHVHPLKVGDLLCDLGRSKDPGRVLAGIQVYRAVPDNRSGADLERATKIQMARWSSTTGVEVCSRPMDYIETRRRGKEHWVGREKGIDVMLAVDLVDMARTDTYDTAVVFSADTDLLPALEAAVRIGKRIASKPELGKQHLPELAEFSHLRENHLTLLFAIHHATDNSIIDDILCHTMEAGDGLEAATLHREETARFDSILLALPKSVLSEQSVEEERAQVRRRMEQVEDAGSELPEEVDDHPSMSTLRIFKNNEIMGQVLRNQHGRLQKDRVEEIVEIVAESSFKLVNLILKDEDEIRRLALRFAAESPDIDLDECIKLLTVLSFFWTMNSIETAVQAVSVPAIREAVSSVVARHNTPAYKILGYFCELDNAEELTTAERDSLKAIYPDHSTDFVGKVLSLRTQMYLNTHRNKPDITQSICSTLGIQYTPRRAIGPSSSRS